MRKKYQGGVLEIIYERKDQEKKNAEEAKVQPQKTLTVDVPVKDVPMVNQEGENSASTMDESPQKGQNSDVMSPKNMSLPNKFNFGAQVKLV
jgi:hypothetical protein